jgi:bifunctional enzyme CysN/CysC
VLEALDRFQPRPKLADRPLRMPVQGVYKFDERRIIAGRIEAGTVKVGDEVIFSPSNKIARVASIEAWHAPETPEEAGPGQSVGVTLETQIFVERGEIMSHVERAPIESAVFKGKLFWIADKPLLPGNTYTLKHGTLECPVTVERIEKVVDTGALQEAGEDAIRRNAVGEVILRTRRMLALDEHLESPATGRFVLVENYLPVAGGQISMEGYPDQRELITVRSTNITAVGHSVTAEARTARNGHKGAVLWFTGLSGAGKSTLALALEAELFAKGYQVYVLDGDNIRTGLNANLSFSPADRAENIRRVGEVANLFADAGFIAISSFISPYRADRQRAREAAGDRFHEVYVKASHEGCEQRDPKGLYKKARAGEIKDFTGIQSPYEEPENAQLVIDTGELSVEDAMARLMAYVQEKLA